jgi:hypothetical protein
MGRPSKTQTSNPRNPNPKFRHLHHHLSPTGESLELTGLFCVIRIANYVLELPSKAQFRPSTMKTVILVLKLSPPTQFHHWSDVERHTGCLVLMQIREREREREMKERRERRRGTMDPNPPPSADQGRARSSASGRERTGTMVSPHCCCSTSATTTQPRCEEARRT